MNHLPIYLDYNATTPCDPIVVEAMLPYFTGRFGNAASRDHFYGWQADDAVEEAREHLAGLIGAKADEIIFTAGATESVNMALKGLVANNVDNHIITCLTEHTAVLDTCAYLESQGCRITYLEVDSEGQISLEALEAAIEIDTRCISLMWANNETGAIHPVKEIANITQRHGLTFFCDATQAVGKIPVNVKEAGIDMMAYSAHKMYGPKGIGALYICQNGQNAKIPPYLHGGRHEKGLRSGTLNVPGIVGFGEAARLCKTGLAAEASRLERLRDRLEQALLNIPGVQLNVRSQRLPQVSNIRFSNINAEHLLLSLSQQLAISRGSACSSNVQKPSHVLKAMGLSESQSFSAVRISIGRFTTADEVGKAINILAEAVKKTTPNKEH
ncbi:cysteine desulfurase family protein [Anditalea andensis]|uniref:cysteine desulfurase n=1 Tax=Anditalea andensis TaxID=1048983 RepID=A0A074KYQ5_9BACT|nr:cysteine desulfurase family protein [Anditalea andensis]KEO74074.1 cysteine desulfurase [Anditalea andensis]